MASIAIHFDSASLNSSWQFLDPLLLRTDLLRGVWYLHSQNSTAREANTGLEIAGLYRVLTREPGIARLVRDLPAPYESSRLARNGPRSHARSRSPPRSP